MTRSAARNLRRVVIMGAVLAIPLAATAGRAQSAVASDVPLVLTNARIVDAVGGARPGLWSVHLANEPLVAPGIHERAGAQLARFRGQSIATVRRLVHRLLDT